VRSCGVDGSDVAEGDGFAGVVGDDAAAGHDRSPR
jgi:hypothetical protein